jgi:SUMO ligase MMS21 Smc5/6 complex component
MKRVFPQIMHFVDSIMWKKEFVKRLRESQDSIVKKERVRERAS